jgi:6-phosphogluconolactonase (cycloisomerase 2 family)
MVEFFTENDSDELNYSIFNSVVYTDDNQCHSRHLKTSKDGKYISLVNYKSSKIKILAVKNPTLALENVHPLGSLITIFETQGIDVAWHSDLN